MDRCTRFQAELAHSVFSLDRILECVDNNPQMRSLKQYSCSACANCGHHVGLPNASASNVTSCEAMLAQSVLIGDSLTAELVQLAQCILPSLAPTMYTLATLPPRASLRRLLQLSLNEGDVVSFNFGIWYNCGSTVLELLCARQ